MICNLFLILKSDRMGCTLAKSAHSTDRRLIDAGSPRLSRASRIMSHLMERLH